MENSNKNFKRIVSIAAPALLFLIIASYTYYKTRDLLRGVVLSVNGITDGETFTEPEVSLTGSAKNALMLSINGREIFIDRNANFSENLLLLPGYNIVAIKAEDKFGKKAEKDYQVTLKQ
jgi:hypothetical protein